jgi:hypothetical protein
MSKAKSGPLRRTAVAVAAGVLCAATVAAAPYVRPSAAPSAAPSAVASVVAEEPAVVEEHTPYPAPAPDHADPAPAPEEQASEPAPPSYAEPVHVSLDRLGISSGLMTLGLNPDGTVEVPPSTRNAPAGWYYGSAEPGELGPTVILGHVDSVHGPGVFYDLRNARAGDLVTVQRADGTAAEFTVDRVATYPRRSFPTDAVYDPLDHPGLRLITCGGTYDKARGGYQANVIVFASLSSST